MMAYPTHNSDFTMLKKTTQRSLLLFTVTALATLSCTSIKPISKTPFTTNPSNTYKRPNTYTQHRAQQKHLTIDGQKTAYTDHGSGSAIVMLHGVPTSSWLYRDMIPSLQKKHRVITIDQLGYGSSDKPKDNNSNYTPQAQARRVKKVMEHLDIDSFSLLFHDMGGLVAWEMLRQSPSSIENLIALNTIIHQKGFHPPKIKPGFATRTYVSTYSNRVTNPTVLGLTFWNLGLRDSLRLKKNECRGYITPMSEGSSEAIYSFFTSLTPSLYHRLDSNQFYFKKFTGNTLILWGEKDKTLTTEQIPFLTTHLRIPKENIHLFPNNNHFLPEEIPSTLNRKIKDFLAQP